MRSSLERFSVAQPAALLAGFVMMNSALFSAALLIHVHQNAHFSGDDIITLELAHAMPFWRFVITPINEHFVPLHRAVAYAANRFAPMNFTFALCILGAFHALGVGYLVKILRRLEDVCSDERATPPAQARVGMFGVCRHQPSWFVLGLYSTHVYISPLFGWWTAGLHRFPFIAVSLICIYYYLRFRDTRAWRYVGLCSAAMLIGLGFYSKAVILPWTLLALEAALWSATSARSRVKNLRLIAIWLAVSLCYVLVWRRFQPADSMRLNSNVVFQLQFLWASWLMLRDSLIGSIHGADFFKIGHQSGLERTLPNFVWLALIASTVWRARRTAYVWGSLILALVPNVLMVSISQHRSGALGVLAAVVNHR